MEKIYVLDTNVLLHDPRSLFSFEDKEVVIPLVVLDELDKKKDGGHDEVARHARMVIRSLDEMRAIGNLHQGVKTPANGTIRVEINHKDHVPGHLDASRADNRIISVILGIKSENPDAKVVLVTKDINLRVKCDALDIIADDYFSDSVAESADSIYSGISDVTVTSDYINLLNDAGSVASNLTGLSENQYILLRSNSDKKHSTLARFQGGKMIPIDLRGDVWGISPKNKEQACAFDALFNPDIKLVTLIGTAGTGKTLLAAAAGVCQLLDGHAYRKVIMTRPVVPLGRDIGFLPGDKDDKMKPWMAPLQDNLDLLFSGKGANYLEMEREAGKIEVEALTYIRGRSIPKTFIILDEAQNLTRHEIKTILTRAGEDSKVVMTGDINQIDSPYIDAVDNGLSFAIEKFKNEPIAAHITLTRGERSELANKASELL